MKEQIKVFVTSNTNKESISKYKGVSEKQDKVSKPNRKVTIILNRYFAIKETQKANMYKVQFKLNCNRLKKNRFHFELLYRKDKKTG